MMRKLLIPALFVEAPWDGFTGISCFRPRISLPTRPLSIKFKRLLLSSMVRCAASSC